MDTPSTATPTREVDTVIIGAGTAGLGARRVVAAHTQDYLVCDPGPLGTTCARVGCMPSKLLIAAAERAHVTAAGERFGVRGLGHHIDGRAVMARVQSERDRFVGFVMEGMEDWRRTHFIPHAARFVAPLTLQIGAEIVRARRIVLAVGSAPVIPALYRPFAAHLETSDSIFEREDLPRSLLVVGVGVIGLELGQAMSRLGVHTVSLGRGGALAGAADPVVRAALETSLKAEMDLRPRVTHVSLAEAPGGVRVRFTEADGPGGDEVFEKILVAAGRRPSVGGLNLEASGLALGEDGVPLYDPHTLQCGDAPVFLAGDVIDERALLHEAADEGRIAGQSAVDYPAARPGARRVPLSIVFTEPNVFAAGASFGDLDLGGAHRAGQVDFDDQGRSRVMGLNRGSMRVYAEAAGGRLVGASGAGPRLEHIGHLLAWAIGAGFTVFQALEMPFYHPVIEEGLRTALRDLARQCRRGVNDPA